MTKKANLNFTFLIMFLFLSQSFLYAQDTCETLELKLKELKERKSEAIVSLQKSEKGLMEAQEILLLARAKGDVKAGQVAEEAIKKFEANISKNKAVIRECEEEIGRIEDVLKLCKGDECNTIESKINRTKEALRRTVLDAQRQSQEYEELQKELENLKALQDELKRLDNQLEFVLNTITSSTLLPEDVKKSTFKKLTNLAKKLDDSILLSAVQFAKDNIELINTLKKNAEKIAIMLQEARIYAEELKEDFNLARKLFDAGLDITDLYSKITKTQNVFERIIKLNNILKVNEYIYKTLYINLSYDLFGEELSVKLYATDKTMDAVEALKMELKREMDIYKTCKELGMLKKKGND